MAAGLPTEGAAADRPSAGSVARRDVPTCYLTESLPNVRERVRSAGWSVCVVINPERIVMGLLRAEQLDRGGDLSAESAMLPGPSTFRPHVSIEEMATYMATHKLPSAPVTTSAGELIGLLFRADAERAAPGAPPEARPARRRTR